MPDISIITPSLNQGAFLERTIESVRTNSSTRICGQSIEHIIIDGGSTDSTQEILKKYAPWIRAFSSPDKGQSHAINKGLDLAQAELIGWLNSDDVYMPGTLDLVIQFFNDHPSVNILYGSANWIDHHNNIIRRYPTEPWNIRQLKEICYLCQPAVFFRKKIIIQYGTLNEHLHYCMDYEYWLRIALAGENFMYLESMILAGSRLHAQTKSFSQKQKAADETVLMLKEKLGYVPPLFILNQIKAQGILAKILKVFMKSIQLNGFFLGIKLIICSPVMHQKIRKNNI